MEARKSDADIQAVLPSIPGEPPRPRTASGSDAPSGSARSSAAQEVPKRAPRPRRRPTERPSSAEQQQGSADGGDASPEAVNQHVLPVVAASAAAPNMYLPLPSLGGEGVHAWPAPGTQRPGGSGRQGSSGEALSGPETCGANLIVEKRKVRREGTHRAAPAARGSPAVSPAMHQPRLCISWPLLTCRRPAAGRHGTFPPQLFTYVPSLQQAGA